MALGSTNLPAKVVAETLVNVGSKTSMPFAPVVPVKSAA